MPELPEVETTRRGIAPYLEGQRVSRVVVRDRRLRWPIPEDLDVRLSGQRIVTVQRRAKYLLINAEVGTLISHLGMSGNLRLVEQGLPVGKHEHVDIELESGLALRYTDPRRFGAMLWSLDPFNHELLMRLGPEPLTDLFDGERLFQLSRGRSMAIKPFIMDNAVVVGVGNIYATEALFVSEQARIAPSRLVLRQQEQTDTWAIHQLYNAITFFAYRDAYQAPAWMSVPRGPDVSPELRWYPIVTMLQLALDMAVATNTPMGFGHVYAPEHYVDAWVAVTDVRDWSAEALARLKELRVQ